MFINRIRSDEDRVAYVSEKKKEIDYEIAAYLCFANRALRTSAWWLIHVNETSRIKTSPLWAQNDAVLLFTYSVSWIAIITSLTMILSDLITTSSPFFFRGCIATLSIRMPAFGIPNTSRAAREIKYLRLARQTPC